MRSTHVPPAGIPAVQPRSTSPLWRLAEVRFGLAQAALILALVISRAADLPAPLVLLVVAALDVRFAARLSLLGAWTLGPTAWAWYTGFVVNDYGQLTFSSADLARLALLAGCGTAAHWRR